MPEATKLNGSAAAPELPPPQGDEDNPEPRRRGAASATAVEMRQADEAALDEFERLERENFLDEDDDEPVGKEEVAVIPVVPKMPKFTPFRVNPDTTFDMWATTDDNGMEKVIVPVSKEFAPILEEEVELRRVRFYETATPDGVVRLVYNFLGDKSERNPNSWLASKQAGLEKAATCWVTMRAKRALQQYTVRPCAKDHGQPQFSGLSRGELFDRALRKTGLLVMDPTHPFYRKAADLEAE